MKIQRTIPPSAAPVRLMNVFYGLIGFVLEKKFISRLENEIRNYFNIRHVFLLSSGKSALAIILKSLNNIDDRRNVIIPAYTCFSVPSAILEADLNVILCDINADTFDFDIDLLKKKIDKNTLCVISSNLFGVPSNVDELSRLCKDEGVYLIEDAAQAMGGEFNGKKIGTIGDVGFFSLGRGKNISAGNGGIILSNSDRISNALQKQYSMLEYPAFFENISIFLKQFLVAILIRPSLYWLPSGLPFLQLGSTFFYKTFPIKKLSGLQAGFLRGWENDLEKSNNMRMENTKYFNKCSDETFSCLRYPVVLKNKNLREKIYNVSKEKGLGLSKMYPSSINNIDEIKPSFKGEDYPVASNLVNCLIALPTHQWLTVKDRQNINDLFDEMNVITKVIIKSN